MDHKVKPVEEQPENLSAIVCFRMRPSEVAALEKTLQQVPRMTRSKLIRMVLATGGQVYVGDHLVDALVDHRNNIARVGNLLKLTAGQLQALHRLPIMDEKDHEEVNRLMRCCDEASAELLRIRKAIAGTLEDVYETLEELTNGNI